MTEKTNNKQKNKKIVLSLVWNLRLGICDFRHKTPRPAQISLTWPKEPGFSGLNKIRPTNAD